MRFQQLKSDSNIIMRKKLVKSKKNWVVISSLMFAGGMLLFGTPDMVHASDIKPTVTNSMPSNTGGTSSSPTLNPVNKNTNVPAKVPTKTVKEDVKTSVTSIKTPTPAADISKKKIEPVSKPAGTHIKSDDFVADTSKKPTETTPKTVTSTKSASNIPTDTKSQVTKPIQAPEVSPIKGQANTTEIVSKNDDVLGWKVTDNNTILHIYGPLTDQKGGNTEHWGGHTKQITTISIDKEVNAPLNSSYLFANMENLIAINNLGNLKFLNTRKGVSNTTNTEGMFKNDSKITKIDLSKNNVRKIRNISHMFENDTSLKSITLSGDCFMNITNGSYAFANDVNLNSFISTDRPDSSSTNAWKIASEDKKDPVLSKNLKVNLLSMFKNDKSLTDLNIYLWDWPVFTETGDSTKGEGMFDGTNLTSITLSSKLHFDLKTYLTSQKGSIWIASSVQPIGEFNPKTYKGPAKFHGITAIDDNQKVTDGLGFLYDGNILTGNAKKLPDRAIYWAVPEPSEKDVTNQVTVHTNQGDITKRVYGKVGDTKTVHLDSRWTASNGIIYSLQSESSVKVTIGQTQAETPKGYEAIYKSIPVDGGSTYLKTNLPKKLVHLEIPAGIAGEIKTITITKDSLPQGYKIKNGTPSTIKVTYSDSSDNHYTFDSTELEITGITIPGISNKFISTPVGKKYFNIPDGTVDTTSEPFTLPETDGYTAPNITATYNANGSITLRRFTTGKDNGEIINPIELTDSSIYTPNETKPGSFVVTLKDGSNGSTDYGAEYVGKTISIDSPEISGYKPNQKQIKGTIDVNGKFIPDPDSSYSYTGDTVKKSELTVSTPDGNETIPIPEGNIGTFNKISLPDIPGYTSKKITVKYVVDDNKQETVIFQDSDGKTIDPSKINNYQGNNTNPGTYTFTLKDGSKATIPYGEETVGKKVHFKAPTINGYHTSSGAQISGTIDVDGKFIPDSSPDSIYQGDIFEITNQSVNTPNGAKNLEIPKGTVGTSTKIDLPPVSGYTTSKITVIYNANKTITLKDDNKKIVDLNKLSNYTGKRFNSGTFHFKLNANSAGSTTYGPVLVGDSLKIKSPAIKGYTSVNEEISGKIDATGNFIPDNPKDLNYTAITITGHSQMILTPVGKEPLQIPDGKVGTSTTLTLPEVNGYTSPTLRVNYGPNGITISDIDNNHSIDFGNSNFYTGVPVTGAKLIVKNPNGLETITLTIPEGKYGDKSKTISAPNLPGYFAPAIIATYQPDGTLKIIDAKNPKLVIDQKQTLTYKKKPSRGSSHHNLKQPDISDINPIQQTISTFADKTAVQIFQLDSNKQMNFVTNRVLNNAISWNSDAKITVNGINYYRIAANQWAQANQVYLYNPINERIRTYDDSAKLLYQAENKLISNRELSVNSAWITDRETEINGQQYYRVATNEFVNAHDVYIYSPVDLIVTTHKVQTKIYTAKGDLVTDRSLANNTSWKVDSITYINNEKYYRVATNEFIKSSDIAIKDVH